MARIAFGVAVWVALAAAQGAEPWEQRAALVEAKRVLDLTQPMLAESERGDPRRAVKALRDPCWALRLLACDRLEAHKLPEATVAALRKQSQPGKAGPSADDPDWEAAWDFADAVRVGGEVPQQVTRGDAVRALVTTILIRVREGPERNKRELLEAALPYSQLVGGETQRWIAGALASLLEPRTLLNDLGAKTLEEAVGDRGRAVLRWYAAHREELVWDPRAKGFRVRAGK